SCLRIPIPAVLPTTERGVSSLCVISHPGRRCPMVLPTPETIFTRDILGNYVCNTFAEAMASGPFDVIILGGGTFGLTLAQDLFFRSQRVGFGSVPEDTLKPSNYRILVLEGGPFALPEHTQDLPNLQLFGPGTQPSASSPLPATRQELMVQG